MFWLRILLDKFYYVENTSNTVHVDITPLFIFKVSFKVRVNKILQIFGGNSDRNTPVTSEFLKPVKAQVIRIMPVGFHVYKALRFDVLLC